MRRLRDRPILEVAVRAILALDHAAAHRAGNLERAVGRTAVGDEHFVGQLLGRRDAGGELLALVLARDDDGDGVGAWDV